MTTAVTTPAAEPTTPSPRTNTLAILSLVFAFFCWPVGLVLGHIAHNQIKLTGEKGKGLATAGLVIGYVCLAVMVLFICATIAALA
jgi:peptidyl-prolyl cis-trans isomerase B (cyclophilin B)